MKYDIFISYKRKSLATANNLYYRLTTRGYSTFFDLEEMRRDNFNEQLLQYIQNAKDIFVILEPGSLDSCERDDWEKDWFLFEVSYALEKGKNIIPVLLNGFVMPSQDYLPDRLKELPLKNAPEFSFSFFEAYLNKLVQKGYITSEPQAGKQATSVFKFFSPSDCEVWKEGKVVCSLEGGSKEPFYLPVERSGEFVFQCYKKPGNKEKTIQATIKPGTEKVINISWGFEDSVFARWKKRHLFWCLPLAIAAVAGVLFLPRIIESASDANGRNEYQKGECVALLHLMRYADLNRHFDHAFTSNDNKLFLYEDSIDQNEHLHIFPYSDILSFDDGDDRIKVCHPADSIPFHFPILQFTLINKQASQINFNTVSLIVSDYHYDDYPVCRFSLTGNKFSIINETPIALSCDFKFASLHNGESFVEYQWKYGNLEIGQTHTERVTGGTLVGLLNAKYHISSDPLIGVRSPEQHGSIDIESLTITEDGEYAIHRINDLKSDIIESADRNLISGETDASCFIALRANKSCEFWVKAKFVSTENKILCSEPIHIRIFIPRTGYESPKF